MRLVWCGWLTRQTSTSHGMARTSTRPELELEDAWQRQYKQRDQAYDELSWVESESQIEHERQCQARATGVSVGAPPCQSGCGSH